jgi:hypothetical protein
VVLLSYRFHHQGVDAESGEGAAGHVELAGHCSKAGSSRGGGRAPVK